MAETLDNPAWHGLNSGNRSLAFGSDQVKYFSRDVSPFLGFDSNDNDRFGILERMIPEGQTLAFFSVTDYPVPEPWELLRKLKVAQMIYEKPVAPAYDKTGIRPLNKTYVPQMLALAKLTNPGPFFKNTIDFGDFFGLFENDQLVAMTGERLKPHQYIEVSAVCTHPDHTGKGYAKNLMANQIDKIIGESCIPFLHVLTENTGAIALYEKLGFRLRTELVIHMIRKAMR